MPTWNRNKLSLIYDKRIKDLVIKYPRIEDGNLILNHLCCNVLKYRLLKNPPFDTFNLIEELEKRGYDIDTLRFSIEKKKEGKNDI